MMSDQQLPTGTTAPAGYGYQTDEVKISPFNFGGNFGVTNLIKFEWIPNGGASGAEQEALDVTFVINKVEKNYRMFPVTKAFLPDNKGETIDPNSAEFKDAMQDFNARVTHILHAFMESEAIQAGLARPISSFKEFCQIVMSMLPKNYKEINLDIFLLFQWQMSEGQERTYLEIPRKMKYGAWLRPAQPGTWVEKRAEGVITEQTKKALWYVNEKGEEHPFVKNGWFMTSNFARQQRVGGAVNGTDAASANAAAATQAAGSAQKSAW